MAPIFEGISLANVLVHLGMFLLVQALVYIILSKSSNVFSKDKNLKSFSFRRARSTSVRRILALLSDQPSEPSPKGLSSELSPKGLPSSPVAATFQD
ncbi:uncharacterized protein LOC141657885 [Silene latifolia]|uniref:uncharacterized protein LOC141657885 n=1 Tax=Silene latifolia TaxID=37657 RepID=UPI003D77F863